MSLEQSARLSIELQKDGRDRKEKTKKMSTQAEVWLRKVGECDGKEAGKVLSDAEYDGDAVALSFAGADGTVYVFPDGSVGVVDTEENSYGDTEVRDSSLHASLPALADHLTGRYTELIKKIQRTIQAVGDTYESASAFAEAEYERLARP